MTSPSEELESAEHIDALLARLRRERGLSQVRFAERLCAASGMHTLSRHEVSRWERGERVPSDRWLPWLATVLDVEPGVLRIAALRSRGGVPGWTMIEPGVWWTLLPENWIILGR